MKLARFLVFLSVPALLIFVTSPLFAQEVPWNGMWIESNQVPEEPAPTKMQQIDATHPVAPSTYGTLSYTTYSLGPCDAFVRDATHTSAAPNCAYISPVAFSSSTSLGFPIHLPNGASIEWVDMHYYDNDATYNPSVGLYYSSLGGLTSISSLTPGAFSGGDTGARFGPFAHTVKNWEESVAPIGLTQNYVILAILNNGAAAYNRIYGFTIWYKLQISPSPAVATFSDVPTSHPFFQHIEALATSGITTGYQDGTFRPDDPVTRKQMAAFIARALGLHWPY